MQELGYLQLAERINFDEMRFIFGHFIHESLFSVANGQPIFLFTGIRAPIERTVSEFHHICSVNRRASRPPPTADEFFAMRRNTMCVEVLRAFPSLAAAAKGSLSERAMEVSRMFDLIYDTDHFASTIRPLLKLMNVSDESIRPANVRSTEAHEGAALEPEIRSRYPEFFGEDEALYRFLKPRVGVLHPFADESGTPGPYRGKWEQELRSGSEGLGKLSEHYATHFVFDYRNLGRLDELDRLLEQKRRWLDLLGRFADEIRTAK